MIPRAYGAALAIPVAFAALVLATTAANGRVGRGPTLLSEREAVVAPRTSDRSLVEVWLSWTEPAGPPGAWITRESLEELGFDASVEVSSANADATYRRQLSRRAFVAFELNGPAWQAVMASREALQPGSEPTLEPTPDRRFAFSSRLVPVAVAPDAESLTTRYPDPRTHLIAAAVVRVVRFERVGGSPYVGGMIASIDPQRIQVPAEHAAALPVRGPADGGQETRYTVSVMYGTRWEPWVAAVTSP